MIRKRYLSQGQMEAAISDAIARFEKEYMGRGPLEIKTVICNDMVIVRLHGTLTRAEVALLKADSSGHAQRTLKELRSELLHCGRSILEAYIKNITKRRVHSINTDINTATDEKIIVFILEKPVELENA